MPQGHEFQFLCAADMAGKMDRVVTFSGGVICSKELCAQGVLITVMKAVE